MNQLYYFFKKNYKEVGFGGSLTFLSSFGQTFLISLYVPEIIRIFSISEGTFGGLYAIATIISSVIMLTVGHTIDHQPVKKVTGLAVLGLAASSFLLGFSHYHIILLVGALIGLRLTGQGLMSHISLTVMSRHYTINRGKALSISSLGYSIGEAVFPLFISTLILWYDYEVAALASGAFLLLYLLKLNFSSLEKFDQDPEIIEKSSARALAKDYRSVIFDKRFSIIMPASFALGFTNTAVFFYQYVFVEDKGWSVTLYASFFTAYAITRFFMSIIGGIWVDKFSAKRMFRLYLIPISLGLLPFAFMDSIAGALIFLILAGFTMGLSGTIKSAVLAEVYGTEKLGAIRSVFTMFMVLSTAFGPFLVGLLLDIELPFLWIMLSLAGLLVLAALNAQRIKGVGAKEEN